jgi:hypothetical protein
MIINITAEISDEFAESIGWINPAKVPEAVGGMTKEAFVVQKYLNPFYDDMANYQILALKRQNEQVEETARQQAIEGAKAMVVVE